MWVDGEWEIDFTVNCYGWDRISLKFGILTMYRYINSSCILYVVYCRKAAEVSTIRAERVCVYICVCAYVLVLVPVCVCVCVCVFYSVLARMHNID